MIEKEKRENKTKEPLSGPKLILAESSALLKLEETKKKNRRGILASIYVVRNERRKKNGKRKRLEISKNFYQFID